MKTKNMALIGLCLVSFLGCIDFTIVNTALPTIQAGLNATVKELQWVINIFMLVLAASMVMMGRLADLYGRRRVLYVGVLIFAIASLGAGLASNISWLIFFRLVQGFGVAILYTVPIAIIPSLFPEHEIGKATGILIAVNGFGLAVGPVIGGFIISAFSWRWIFFVNLPIIVIAVALCLKSLPESKSLEHGDKVDWLGFILLAIFMPSAVYATVNGSSWGWASAETLSFYALAIISGIGFYIAEKKSKSPIINFKLFANRFFAIGLLANFCLAFFYTVDFFLLPFFLHNVHGDASYQIGLILLAASAMLVLLSTSVGKFVDKNGPKKLLILGFCLFVVAALMQAFFASNTALWFILLAMIAFGVAWAFILSPSIITAVSSVPRAVSGVAMGTVGTLHNFGGAIGLAIGTALYHYRAKLALHSSISNSGGWADKAIADPDHAVRLIMQHTGASLEHANRIFNHFFMHGFSAAMVLLAIVSVIALIIVSLGLKRGA